MNESVCANDMQIFSYFNLTHGNTFRDSRAQVVLIFLIESLFNTTSFLSGLS